MFACCLLLMVVLVHSSLVHENNSTSPSLRLRREPAVERENSDNPAVAWTLLRVLDSMAHTLEGPGEVFPRREFHTIMGSMFRLDRGLIDSQERGWRGVIDYYKAGGGPGDAWGSRPSSFLERNATVFPLPGEESLLAYQPCNYASNVAYYQLVVGLAKSSYQWRLPRTVLRSLGQASAALALGSAFYHASNTRLGQKADELMISVMSLIMHQASLSGLPESLKTPELVDLGPSRRSRTGVQIAQDVTDMYSSQPPTQWRSTLEAIDLPRYEVTFSALITTLITLLLPPSLGEPLMAGLIDAFGVPQQFGEFITKAYYPQIRGAMARVRLPIFTKLQLLKNTLATVGKLVFAFLFQEQTFDIDAVTSPAGVQIGAFLQPVKNTLLSLPSSLPNLAPKLTLGSGPGLYPGSSWCRSSQPHSLWHSQSAAGLLDFFLLVDNLVATIY